jgi:hypothetical protein
MSVQKLRKTRILGIQRSAIPGCGVDALVDDWCDGIQSRAIRQRRKQHHNDFQMAAYTGPLLLLVQANIPTQQEAQFNC